MTAARLVRVVLVVYGVRFLLGPWSAAVVAAAACLWWGVRAWHRWESPHRSRALIPQFATHRPERNPGHVYFARALAAVAAEYLARCEQEAEL